MEKLKQNFGYIPIAVRNARKDGKGFNIFLEGLIFFAVFAVISVFESVFLFLPVSKYIYSSLDMEELSNNPLSGISAAMELIQHMPAWLIAAQLFATIPAIITVIIYCRFIEKRKLSTMGLTGKMIIPEYLKGLLTGLIMISATVLICIITGSVKFSGISLSISSVPVLLIFLAGFVFQGAEEEILCRGYLMVSSSRKSPVAAGILLNSVVFGLLHIFNPGVKALPIINIILFGVFMSLYFIKRGNLWGVCAIHSIWNFSQGCLYGFEVSGMSDLPSVMRFKSFEEKSLINGGLFGPEGGIAVSVVITAAIIIVMLIPGHKEAGQTEE